MREMQFSDSEKSTKTYKSLCMLTEASNISNTYFERCKEKQTGPRLQERVQMKADEKTAHRAPLTREWHYTLLVMHYLKLSRTSNTPDKQKNIFKYP